MRNLYIICLVWYTFLFPMAFFLLFCLGKIFYNRHYIVLITKCDRKHQLFNLFCLLTIFKLYLWYAIQIYLYLMDLMLYVIHFFVMYKQFELCAHYLCIFFFLFFLFFRLVWSKIYLETESKSFCSVFIHVAYLHNFCFFKFQTLFTYWWKNFTVALSSIKILYIYRII